MRLRQVRSEDIGMILAGDHLVFKGEGKFPLEAEVTVVETPIPDGDCIRVHVDKIVSGEFHDTRGDATIYPRASELWIPVT